MKPIDTIKSFEGPRNVFCYYNGPLLFDFVVDDNLYLALVIEEDLKNKTQIFIIVEATEEDCEMMDKLSDHDGASGERFCPEDVYFVELLQKNERRLITASFSHVILNTKEVEDAEAAELINSELWELVKSNKGHRQE